MVGVGASKFAPIIKNERLLYDYVVDGKLDDSVLALLMPNGSPMEYEGALWDYKASLPNVSGKIILGTDDPSDRDVAELIKDVVAFYNSFGGYILAGIGERTETPIVGCKNVKNFAFTVEKLNDRLRAYTKAEIKCRFRTFEVIGTDGPKCLGLLHIPQRPAAEPVTQMTKGAPEGPKGQAFEKGEIFARIDDKCLPARHDHRIIPFVCSQRLLSDTIRNATSIVDNNLPARDPNLLRFVGRTEYLNKLWRWMVERNAPLKVLTALGGTGKTSIAYEFCSQIVQEKPSWLEKVIWLSAKRQTFSAIQGKKYSTSRVDFSSVSSFFRALAVELAASDAELAECDDVDDLVEVNFDLLTALRCLVVVDDIDTLLLEEQAELFSQIQALSGRVFAEGSRFLVTSRLEFGGVSQRIKVEGFPEKEFADYVELLTEETSVALPKGMLGQLHKASLGSPMFAASIFRLARLGTPLHAAIREWKGRAGEDVRRFAFQREIEQLTDAEIRTLFALVTLGETTQLELGHILEIDQQQLIQHLSKIREFHLFVSSDALLSGAKLTVPPPITLMLDLIRQRVSDPTRIEKECAKARSKSPKAQDQVSYYTGQIIALWKEDAFDEALFVALEAVKRVPRSSDLPCLLGRCFLRVSPPKPREADKAFRKAFDNHCARVELAPLWIEAKCHLSDWMGIKEIAGKFPQSDLRGSAAHSVSLAEAKLGVEAAAKPDLERAAQRFKSSMFSAQNAIRDGRAGDTLPELREIARESARRYVSLVDQMAPRPGDRLKVFNAVYDAFICHVSESAIVLLGAVALLNWAHDVFRRVGFDANAAAILESKLSDLADIIEHVDDERYDRSRLADDLRKIWHRLGEDLRTYEDVTS